MEVTDGEEIECGECGRSVAADRPFCPFCGSSLEIFADLGDEIHEGLGKPDSAETVQTKPDSQDGLPGLEDFDIKDEISRGGMGIVYRAVDRRLDRLVAIKVIAPDLANDYGFRARFVAESKAIASLNNPHILPIYQTGGGDETLFQVTKYANGGDLAEELKRMGKLDLRQVTEIVSEIADALDAAHEKGLVHRDVKPANILIDRPEMAGGRPSYLLSDFGVATSREGDSRLTETGEVLGTVDYMAPEQIEGRDFDQRVDVYALGCVAMELLAGEPPFRRDSKQATMMAHLREDPSLPSRIEGADPQTVAAVFGRALAKDPDQRYQTCTAFARDLENASGGEGIPVPTAATSTIPPVQQSTAMRGRAILAGLGAVLLLGIGAGAFLYVKDQDAATDPGSDPPVVVDPDPEVPAEPAPEPEPEPTSASTTTLTTLAEEGDLRNKDDFGGDEIFTAATFAEGVNDGDYPRIGPQEFRDAIVIDGYALGKDEPVEAQATLKGYDAFNGLVGAEAGLLSGRVLRLKVEVTQGNGNLKTVWDRTLKSGAQPTKMSFPLRPDDSQISFSLTGEDYVGEYYEETDYLVIANGEFTQEESK